LHILYGGSVYGKGTRHHANYPNPKKKKSEKNGMCNTQIMQAHKTNFLFCGFDNRRDEN